MSKFKVGDVVVTKVEESQLLTGHKVTVVKLYMPAEVPVWCSVIHGEHNWYEVQRFEGTRLITQPYHESELELVTDGD